MNKKDHRTITMIASNIKDILNIIILFTFINRKNLHILQ